MPRAHRHLVLAPRALASCLSTTPAGFALVVGILAAGCASTDRSTSDEVRRLVAHGDYDEAVHRAASAASAAPDDAALAALHREASLAWLIEQGRRSTFADEDETALEWFEKAVALDPESRIARDWRDKTNRKLSKRWLDRALELHAKDDMEAALAAYETALRYEPADPDAMTGRNLSLQVLQHRGGLGKTYFDDGLRALADYWLEQARSRFSYSHKYQPTDPRTKDRRRHVEVLLAAQRVALGEESEKAREFGTARMEYRLALTLEPDNAAAKAGVERCTKEIEVTTLLTRASMDITRGRFDLATQLAEEALAKSEQQKDVCQGKLDAIREARLEKEYQAALALERDDRFEEASQAYGEILAKVQYYKDVIARKDTADEYVRLAADLYARATAATDPAAKLALLRQIQVFWPQYKDVETQIAELTKPTGS